MQHMQGNSNSNMEFVDARRAYAGSTPSDDTTVGSNGNYASSKNMDALLIADAGTLYNTALLDKMTSNDKVYAIRLLKDPGSF